MAEESVKAKAVNGAKWSMIDNLLKQGMSFIIGVVLARLLSPTEYGQIGIMLIFMAVFNIFIDSGFTDALVRKKDANEKDYNTVFLINLGVSCICALLFFFGAPLIGFFFHDEGLTPLAQAMSVILIINALSIVQRVRLVKRVDFKTQTKISLISVVTSGAVGISLAFSGFGVWALVVQQITNQSMNTLCLWYFNRWFPSFTFGKESFLGLWKFGCNILASQILNAVWTQIYQVVIGRFYNPASLGLYTRSQQFANLLSGNITSVVQRVSYPVLAMIQDDPVRLKNGYQRVIKTTQLVTCVMLFGLLACAKPLITVLLGDKWLECVPFLQILCISYMLLPLHAINLNGIAVKGRSDLCLRLEIIKKCIATIPIVVGIFVNIYAMLLTSVVIGFLSYYINAYYSKPLLNYGFTEQVKDITPSFLIGGTMCLCILPVTMLPLHSALQLAIQIVIGAGVAIALCRIFKIKEYYEIIEIIGPVLRKLEFKK